MSETQVAPKSTSGTKAPPQLSFVISNPGAPDTIYITADVNVNKPTLTMTGNVTATFAPGQPVPRPEAAKGTGSLVYIDLAALKLSAAQFDQLTLSATGWHFEKYATGQIVCMTPTGPSTLRADDAIDIEIAKLTLDAAPAPGVSVTVSAYRVEGVTVGNIPAPSHFKVLFRPAPGGAANLRDVMALRVEEDHVVNSVAGYDPVDNLLRIIFGAAGKGSQVVAGRDTVFTLTFVHATDPPGYGALWSPQQALEARLVAGENAAGWGIEQNQDEQNPLWHLRPREGKPIVGTGAQSTVSFDIEDVVTDFQAGPTMMYVTWAGIPGYEDGSWAIALFKVPHVVIRDFTVTPNPAVLSEGGAEVTISWEVEDAGTLTLSRLGYKIDVTGETSCSAEISKTTHYILEADGTKLADNGNIAIANVVASVRSVVNSFEASQTDIHNNDFPRTIALTWDVNTNEKVILRSSTRDWREREVFDSEKPLEVEVKGPQTFTLDPSGGTDPSSVRCVVIAPFAAQVSHVAATGGAPVVATPRNARFVVVAPTPAFPPAPKGLTPEQYQSWRAKYGAWSSYAQKTAPAPAPAPATPLPTTVTAFDAFLHHPIGAPIPVGKNPVAMALSPDDTTLYVANAADSSLSIIRVTVTDGFPWYEFSNVGTVPLGGSPQRVAVSPGGDYVFVAMSKTTGPGSLAIFSVETGGGLKQISHLDIPPGPTGIAVARSGKLVVIACRSSKAVWLIRPAPDWTKTPHTSSLPGLVEPTDVAITDDGHILLVTCAGTNTVQAVSVETPTSRAALSVGAKPQSIARLPGDTYALVTNHGDATVSLLRLDSDPAKCKVVERTFAKVNAPSGVAVDGGGRTAYVGSGAGLSVLALTQYVPQGGALPQVGSQPTDVVVSPKGGQVVAWHDWVSPSDEGKGSTGLFVYDVKTGHVAYHLEGHGLVGFCYHPNGKTAFSIRVRDPMLRVLATDTWKITHEIPLTAWTSGNPLRLGIAADGTTLFLLAGDMQDPHYDLLVFVVDERNHEYRLIDNVRIDSAKPDANPEMAVRPDGSAVYFSNWTDSLLWFVGRTDSGRYQLQASMSEVRPWPTGLTVAPDGSRIFLVTSSIWGQWMMSVDATTRSVARFYLPIITETAPQQIAAVPDGTRLFATDPGHAAVRVFDAKTLRPVQTLPWDSGAGPCGIAFAPDASAFYTANTWAGTLGIARRA